MGKGNFKPNKVYLKPHEFETVKVLLEAGYDIELIPPSDIKGHHRPDIILNGAEWEMKAPEGGGKSTIKHNIQNAAHQSDKVIIDLLRCKLSQEQAIKEIKHHFELSRRIKQLKIVTKTKEIIDLKK